MTQMKALTYTLDLDISNGYLEVIIQSLEHKIFNEKVEILFDFFLYYRIKPLLSH